jgi:hypothetical protein
MTQENKSVLAEQKSNISSDLDSFLMSLVEMVELDDKVSGRISITLFIQGSIVSGLLIGEYLYFEALKNVLGGFNPGSDETKEAPFQSLSTNLPDNSQKQG